MSHLFAKADAVNASEIDLAYCAGTIDSDGCITIKMSTYGRRVRQDCRNATYAPRIALGQVTDAVPLLLKSIFGGSIYVTRPGTKNSRPLYKWMASDRSAAIAARTLLPFLRIKFRQAEALVDLYELKTTPKANTVAYWFSRDNPEWASGKLLTSREVASMLGLNNIYSVSQAVRNATLLSTISEGKRKTDVPHVPEGLVVELIESRMGGKHHISSPRYVSKLHEFYEQVKMLNQLGMNGTILNRREGYYARVG